MLYEVITPSMAAFISCVNNSRKWAYTFSSTIKRFAPIQLCPAFINLPAAHFLAARSGAIRDQTPGDDNEEEKDEEKFQLFCGLCQIHPGILKQDDGRQRQQGKPEKRGANRGHAEQLV